MTVGDTGAVANPFGRRTLSWKVSLLIAFLLIASAIVTIVFAFRAIRSELYDQSREAASNVHSSVSDAVQADYEDIQAFRRDAVAAREAELRDVAAPVKSSLKEFKRIADSGEMSTQQAQQAALETVRDVRFGKDDYFFVYDLGLTAIAHPDPRFQGRNLEDFRDADGKYVLREIRRASAEPGGGLVKYRWPRLNGKGATPKIAYVFRFEPWGWIVGTGVYAADIQADVQRRIEQIRDNLELMSKDISFQRDGFFFILDRQGQVVVAPSPRVLQAEDTARGQETINEILAAAPTSPNVEKDVNVVAPWSGTDKRWNVRMSTTGGDLDWILVTAVPRERLEAPGARLAMQLVVLSLVVLLIGLALGILVSRRITKPVDDITSAARNLRDGTFDPSALDAAAGRKDEVGDLARTFQSMGIEIVERERRLQEKVEQLTVQIDRAKVREDVQQITESEYFQELKARSEELRRRDN